MLLQPSAKTHYDIIHDLQTSYQVVSRNHTLIFFSGALTSEVRFITLHYRKFILATDAILLYLLLFASNLHLSFRVSMLFCVELLGLTCGH